MKLLYTLAAVLVICALSANAEKTLDQEWEDFKVQFKREFDADEDAVRKEIFANTLKKINDHNVKYKAGEVTYELGINHFADRKPEELKKNLGKLGGR